MPHPFLELLVEAKPNLLFSPVSYGVLFKLNVHQLFSPPEKELHGEATDLYLKTSVWRTTGFSDVLADPAWSARYPEVQTETRDALVKAEIDAWIREATKGLIDGSPVPIDTSVRLLLMNVLYFKQSWQYPFLTSRSRPTVFHAPTGDVTRDFMFNGSDGKPLRLGYRATENFRSVLLPYAREGLVCQLVLPAENTDRVSIAEAVLRNAPAGLAGKHAKRPCTIALPRFTLSTEQDLTAIMHRAVAGHVAAAGGAAELPLPFDEVRQAVKLIVDEAGTEGAALTMERTRGGGWSVPDLERLVFDRPFMFRVVDLRAGVVFFVGWVGAV